MTTRRGYLVALGVLLAGFAVSGLMLWRTYGQVAAFNRVDIPGEAVFNLVAGDYVAYVEPTAGAVGSPTGRCQVQDAAGTAPTLTKPSGQVSYTMGRYQGRNAFEFTLAVGGPTRVTCDGEGGARLAIGGGLGAKIVIAVVAGMGGFLLAIIVAIRTFRRRRRQARGG